MTFTKEQLEVLKEAEPHFKTAQNGWVRYAPKELSNIVADTFFQATGQVIPKTWSCSVCVLNLYRRVGYFYFQDLEEQASNEPELSLVEDTESKKPPKVVANKDKKDGSKSRKK